MTSRLAFAGLKDYFWFYNNERAHHSRGGKTPAEVYLALSILKKVA